MPSIDRDLLDAARRAFASHGWAGAPIERIAAEAGLSRVTLHIRGITKAAVLEALVASATEDYRTALWPALTGRGPGSGRLVQALEAQALEALCDQAEEHMAVLLAFRAQRDAIFHRPSEKGALTATVFTEAFQKLLAEGADDGSLRSVDAAEMATTLFNLVGWTYIHLRSGHGWAPERARRCTLDPVLHGLLRRPTE